MDFKLTDEQQAARDLAREIAEGEIKPVAHQLDERKEFPSAILKTVREAGLLHVTFPEAYGGAGLGILEWVLAIEQFAWGCAGVATAIAINSLTGDAIIVAGSEGQQAEWLGRMAAGEYGAYALTEPGAGSDVANIQTRARETPDGYALSGSKIWISNATVASFFVVFAKTDPEAGRKGISAFVVERDSPGVTVGNPLPKLGQRASHAAEIFFDNVTVPRENLLGQEGEGFLIAMQVFDRSRPVIAANGVGLIQRCLDESLAYASQRQTMGQPIIQHQAISHKLAEMGMRGEAARLLTYQSAALHDAGQRNTLQAAYAKLMAADSAMWSATEAIQIFGGAGYSEEFPVAKLFRDAKLLQIYEGTSEIQHNIIARELARGVARA
jgi:acyl-CoA dehydrogenase